MNVKNIAPLGLCVLILISSLYGVVGKAEDTGIIDSDTLAVVSIADVDVWYPVFGRILYNQGNSKGTFVNFRVDGTTGFVTDYTVKLTFYPMYGYSGYSPIDSKRLYVDQETGSNEIIYENKTIFDSIQIEYFEPQATPQSYADYLILQGRNTFLKITDREGGAIHVASSNANSKIKFNVPEGFVITQNDHIVPEPEKEFDVNGDPLSPMPVTTREIGSYPWQTVWIKSDNTTTSINTYNGTIIVDGQTVNVELGAHGYLDIYTWVEYLAPSVVNDFWYNDLNITNGQTIIEDAKLDGTITAEGWVTSDAPSTPPSLDAGQSDDWDEVKITNTALNNIYTYNDPTFQMTFNIIDKNGVDVVVDSQISTGRIIIINIDKEVLQTKSIEELLVHMDESQIQNVASLEDLMQKVENKDKDAAYYALLGEYLTTVFVYVPHFSTHTISITSLSDMVATSIILPSILSVSFIVLIVGGMIVQKKKQRDDF